MEDASNLRSLRAGYRPCSTFGLKSLHWSDFFTASAFRHERLPVVAAIPFMGTGSKPDQTSPNDKTPPLAGFDRLVAGRGFEPLTFRL